MDLFKICIILFCAFVMHAINDLHRDMNTIKAHCVKIEDTLDLPAHK